MEVEKIFEKALEASRRGDLDEAIRLYEEALNMEELPEILNNLGNVYRRKGLLAKAIQAYRRAMEIDPDYPTARLNLALSFLEMGRYGEALMIAEGLKEKGEDLKEVDIVLAVSYAKLGRYAEFIRVYRKLGKDFDHILRDYGVDPGSFESEG